MIKHSNYKQILNNYFLKEIYHYLQYAAYQRLIAVIRCCKVINKSYIYSGVIYVIPNNELY